MEIRKANKYDKDKIIELWRYCFNNDSEAFVNHYFTNIFSPDNTLLAIDSQNITTSIQLNPYVFNFNAKNIETKYIVALSSFPENRGSGSVKELFKYIFDNLYQENYPFVFLMGADYGLYTPFGFTSILDKQIISGRTKLLYQKTEKLYEFKKISINSTREELESLIDFYKKILVKNYSSFLVRDSKNFTNNLNEIASDNGFAYYLKKNDEVFGCFFYYFDKKKIVIKEMLYSNIEVLKEILKFVYNHNTQFDNFEIRDDFYKTTSSLLQNPREINVAIMPFLMGRIINLKEFFNITNIQNKLKDNFTLQVKDTIIDKNNLLCKIKNGNIEYIENDNLEDYDLSIDVSLLLPLFLGYLNKDEIILYEHLYKSLNINKTKVFFDLFKDHKNIFFNEYV